MNTLMLCVAWFFLIIQVLDAVQLQNTSEALHCLTPD